MVVSDRSTTLGSLASEPYLARFESVPSTSVVVSLVVLRGPHPERDAIKMYATTIVTKRVKITRNMEVALPLLKRFSAALFSFRVTYARECSLSRMDVELGSRFPGVTRLGVNAA